MSRRKMKLRNTKARQARKPDASTAAPTATPSSALQSSALLDWQRSHKLHDGLSFLDLSQELRDMIYEECLVSVRRWKQIGANNPDPPMVRLEWIDPAFKGVRNKQRWVNTIPGIPNPAIRSTALSGLLGDKPQTAALLAVCRQIHAEAAPVMYGKNIFELCAKKRPDRQATLDRTGIYPLYAPLIRRMCVSLDFEWKDYRYLTMRGIGDLMAVVHKDILPFCTSLNHIRWKIVSNEADWYGEDFWKKWEPLWRRNRDGNFEARIALFTDSLNELRPEDGILLPFLELDIDTLRSSEWVVKQFHWDNRMMPYTPQKAAQFVAIRKDMVVLREEFPEAFRRMKEQDAITLIANDAAALPALASQPETQTM